MYNTAKLYLCDNHDGEESCKGEHHAGILGACPTAAEKAKDENNGAQNYEEYRGIHVRVVKVVQVVSHLKIWDILGSKCLMPQRLISFKP